MYLSWEGEYIQTGCWGVLGGTRQGQDSAPPGSSTASRVPWGLSLCCAGELSTCQRTLSMGQNSSGAVTHLGQRAVWQPWGLQWLGWGTRDPGWCSWQSSWKAQLGTSNTSCSLQLSVTGGAGYNPFYFFFLLQYIQLCYKSRWSIKNLPPWVSMILGFSGLQISVIAFFTRLSVFQGRS